MTEPTWLRDLASTRRRFLGGVAAGAAFPAALLHRVGNAGDPGDMAAAQRLFGLEFGEKDLVSASRRIQQARANYEALRRREVSFWDAPAWRFDPLPPGAPPPATGPRPEFAIAKRNEDPKDTDLHFASIRTLAGLLRSRKLTSRRLTEACIARIKALDPKLLCVVTLLEKEALAAADQADREMAIGKIRGPLHGIPYGAKDLFAWPGAPTTFGAAPYQDQVLDRKATVLEKLENAGAVLVAKLSLGALAMGDVWFKGRTRNPWNLEQGSSGSSAGPAAAVAGGLLPFALGTETCGSILSPCTRCGVAGLRPTFGQVSRAGAMPLSWSMDKVGPIARNAEDLAIVFDAIRGTDGRDTMMRDAAFAWTGDLSLEGMTVGLVQSRRTAWDRGPNKKLTAWLEDQGAKTQPFRFPDLPYGGMMQILSVEAATAFDDLTRSPDLGKLRRQDRGSWPHTFRAARFVPAVEFLRATRIRSQLLVAMAAAMQPLDLVLSPNSGTPLYATNLSGHPALAMPFGAGRNGGAPVSITAMGKLYGESTLLRLAAAWQRDTRFHRGQPL